MSEPTKTTKFNGLLTVVGAVSANLAHIYDSTSGTLVATLNNPTPSLGDEFGIVVGVSGNTVVVGAPLDDEGAPDSGAAYVFNATTGNLVATLHNPSPAYGESFGYSVAVSGNVVVVGAYRARSAYVFDATTGELIQTLTNSSSGPNFGLSVAVSGGVAVVGASNFPFFSGGSIGTVSAFDVTTGALKLTLTQPEPYGNHWFGRSVAVSDNTIVVGSYLANGQTGAAYVFDSISGNLIRTLNNPGTIRYFGYSVTVSDNTIVVGVLGTTSSAGVAYAFSATSGVRIATLRAPTPTNDDRFGESLAVAGNRVVAGAYGQGTRGAAYIYGLPRTIKSIQVNGGAVQRSRVTSLQITFSSVVTFATTPGAAFTLTRNSAGAALFTATSVIVGEETVVTLDNFVGAETEFGSLSDGRYTLTLLSNQISAGGQQLNDGVNYSFGSAQGLFRYYGDTNGDRRVDVADFGFFSLAYLTTANYNAALDFNNDGRIDIADFGQFSVRYFTTLP